MHVYTESSDCLQILQPPEQVRHVRKSVKSIGRENITLHFGGGLGMKSRGSKLQVGARAEARGSHQQVN